jgi:hypothetical protein
MTGKFGVLKDEQWEELLPKGRGLGLTNEMRGSIDWHIQLLIARLQKQKLDEKSLIPRDLKAKLRALAEKVEIIAKELDLPEVGHAILAAEALPLPPSKITHWNAELVGDPPPMRGGRQPKKVSQPITFFAFTKYLGQLPTRLQQAATLVQLQQGKTHDADYRQGFLKILDVLLHHRISQSDAWYKFLGAVYEIAGCRVGEESIKKDIEKVQKDRPATFRRSPPRRSA